jgi:glycosyltransferase involved in cell wall biosynthesis
MKIVYVIDSLSLGGAQRHLLSLVRGLNGRGHHATVFSLNSPLHPLIGQGMVSAGAQVRVLGKAQVACGAAVVKIAGAVRRERAALVVTTLFFSTVVGRLAARLSGVPELTCLMARNVDHRVWKKALLRYTAFLGARTVSNSRSAIPYAARHEGADPRRCDYVPNGIEAPVAAAGPLDWRALGWPQLAGRRVIGSIARLHPQKGHDILLSAFARLAQDHRDLALLLVGVGSSGPALIRQARRLGLEDRIVFAGERSDAAALLYGLELYVQPSRFEGTPYALMEAMSAGVPVVASAVDGISEVLTPDLGWLVPADDAEQLAAGLADALGNPALCSAKAERARASVLSLYSLAGMIDAYEKIFAQTAGAAVKATPG